MVPLTFLRKATRSVPLLLAALIFAGCGTVHLTRAPPILRVPLRLILAFICNKCRRVQMIPDQLAITRHSCTAERGKTQQAAELFGQLPKDLNDTQRLEQSLLSAELKVAQKEYDSAKRS